VAHLLAWIGFRRKCSSCQKRQAWLNRHGPLVVTALAILAILAVLWLLGP
jgi:hypothetical protein